MAFSEATELEAKRRSHFACVICHQPFVEVHHILPQANGGADELDNAAPLCGSCHDLFGANPVKRKQIREMRDFSWEICEKKPANPNFIDLNKKLDDLQHKVKASTGVKFCGEYNPDVVYNCLDMVVISAGSNAGTFIYINSTPCSGKAPYYGGGCWMQLPNGGGNVWL